MKDFIPGPSEFPAPPNPNKTDAIAKALRDRKRDRTRERFTYGKPDA